MPDYGVPSIFRAQLVAGLKVTVPAEITTMSISDSSDAQAILPLLKNFESAAPYSGVDGESPLTVILPDMDWTSPTTLYMPRRGVAIDGAAMTTSSFTGVSIISNSAGNHEIQLTGVSSTTNATAGSFGFVVNVVDGSGRGKAIEGVLEILSKTSSTVNLRCKAAKTLPSLAGISDGDITFPKTIIRFEGMTGFDSNYESGALRRMAIAGDGAGTDVYGIRGIEGANIKLAQKTSHRLGIANFAEAGINLIHGARGNISDTFVSGCGGAGIIGGNGASLNLVRVKSTHHASHSLTLQFGSTGAGTVGFNGSGCGQNALYVASNSRGDFDDAILLECVDAAARTDEAGHLAVPGATMAGCDYGARSVGKGSIIYTAGATYADNATDDEREENDGVIYPTASSYKQRTQYLSPATAPSNPSISGQWVLYVDSGDSNKLKAKHSSGTVVTLATP